MVKKIINSKFIQILLTKIIYYFYKLTYKTTKWEIKGEENLNLLYQDKSYILVFWHNRLGILPFFSAKFKNMNAVVSSHKDGEILCHYLRNFGVSPIRGSSKKNAFNALKNSLRILKNNGKLAITPDGPRGPLMKVNGNLLYLSQATNTEIIMASFSIGKYKIINSWDRFIIPLPFSKGHAEFSEPFMPENNQEIEDKLTSLSNRLDKISGLKL